MPNVNYGQIRQERVWVRAEPTFNVATAFTAEDTVICRGRATLPSVLTDRVPSEEVRPQAPDTDFLIDRKKPPGEFEIPCYAKAPSTVGRLPQCAALLANIFGSEAFALTVVTVVGITGKTVTVTVAPATTTVLTEGVDWTAGGTPSTAATALAAAITALAGVTATADGADVLITRDQGTGDVTVTTNAAVTIISQELRYTLITDILEKSLTIAHLADNVLHVYRGCHASAVAIEVSGTDEGTMRFTGYLGNEVLVAYHTLDGAILSGATSFVTNENPRVLIGPNVDDVVYVVIDSEEFKVTAVDYTTKTWTVVGAQNGTVAAGHADDAVISPLVPDFDPDPADTILPMTLGTFVLDGVTYRVAEATVGDDEQLEPRIDEWGEPALTGYRRPLEGRVVSCDFTAYQQRTVLDLLTLAERGERLPLVITIGRVGVSPQIVVSLPLYQIIRPEKEERGGEFARSFTGIGLASTDPGNDGIAITYRYA